MTSKATQDKLQKYFFTENIFDEGYVEEAPPPTFSEQELATAEQKQFTQGKQAGLHEAENSQLKVTAQILDKIQKQLTELNAAEGLREKIYEQETLRLCLAVFEKLFPLYNEQAGFEELKHSMSAILKRQEGQNHILVAVMPDVAPAIEEHLNKLKEAGYDIKFTVKGDETVTVGGCRLTWADGGAVRNPQMLADEIRTSIQQVLAKKGLKGHDRHNKDPVAGPDGDAA